MKRHKLWREQYRHRRYMEYLNENDLHQRLDDVLSNLLNLNEKGQLGPRPNQIDGEYWMILSTHILEEFSLRGIGLPPFNSLVLAHFPKFRQSSASKAAVAIRGKLLVEGKYLYKYGKEKFLRPALENGHFRISPASFYNDSSLNHAIRDNELEVSIECLPTEIMLHVIDECTKKIKHQIKPMGNVKFSYGSCVDYYVYCLSKVYDFRLFDDFDNADSCLVIREPLKFADRMVRKLQEKLPEWYALSKEVLYVDPLNAKDQNIDVCFSKHFRYAYQKAYRIVCLPASNKESKLDHVYIEIGSLKECAELIAL